MIQSILKNIFTIVYNSESSCSSHGLMFLVNLRLKLCNTTCSWDHELGDLKTS